MTHDRARSPALLACGVLLVGLAILSGGVARADSVGFDEMLVFGASAVDTGNIHIRSGGFAAAPPYFGGDVGRGRLSNGTVWVERLADKLDIGQPPTESMPMPGPSLAGGTNYAFAGASSGMGYTRPCFNFPGGVHLCVPTIGMQVERMLEDRADPELDGDELIVIAASGNDPNGHLAARQITTHVETLYAEGGRHFLIANVPRFSRAPGGTPPAYWDVFAEHYRDALNDEAAELRETLGEDVEIDVLDLLALSDDIIANPGDFGLENVDDPACPGCGGGVPAPDAADDIESPDLHLWWDQVHVTRVVHEIIADEATELVEE